MISKHTSFIVVHVWVQNGCFATGDRSWPSMSKNSLSDTETVTSTLQEEKMVSPYAWRFLTTSSIYCVGSFETTIHRG